MKTPPINCPTGLFSLWAEFPLPGLLLKLSLSEGFQACICCPNESTCFDKIRKRKTGMPRLLALVIGVVLQLILWRKRAGACSLITAARAPLGGAWICRLVPGAGSSSLGMGWTVLGGRCHHQWCITPRCPPPG